MKVEYGKKSYMSQQVISKVRLTFYTRVRMEPFAGNFQGDKIKKKLKYFWKRRQKNTFYLEIAQFLATWR